MTRASIVQIAIALLVVTGLFVVAVRFAAGPLPERTAVPGRGAWSSDQPFPRTISDHHGDLLNLPAPPQRIGSQALVTDHYLFAVAPRDRIVAVSEVAQDSRYSFVADLVLGLDAAIGSDPEAVLRKRPDLLLVSHAARAELVEVVRSAGTPVFRMRTVSENFQQITDALRQVGYLTGEDEAANGVVERLQKRLDRARSRRTADAASPRVLVYSGSAFTMGRGSLMDSMLRELGAINIAAERGVGPVGSITSEHVAAWNPEWIIASAEPGTESSVRSKLQADAGVKITVAGRKRQFVILENRAYLSMSHHAVEAMEAISAALYPEGS